MHKSSFWDYDMAGRSRSRLAFFFLTPLLFFSNSCTTDPSVVHQPVANGPPFRAFYHWRTAFSLSDAEQLLLDSLGVDRLYVKFFDVDWEPGEGAVPLAAVQLDTQGLHGRQLIPTVFLTNRTLTQIAPDSIPLLASNMVRKIDALWDLPAASLREIQIDCDWTASSRLTYFALLEALDSLYQGREVQLSATIRLHQLRYPERTGLPPVDKGVLMFYNMGDLQDWSEPNSILNLEKAAAYLPDDLQYPMPLDLALPLFRWAVLYRDQRMIKLINEPDLSQLQQSGHYQLIGPGRYQVTHSTYLDGYYLYQGDQLRIESIDADQLRAAWQLVHRQIPAAAESLIFYHLDSAVVARYPAAALNGIADR